MGNVIQFNAVRYALKRGRPLRDARLLGEAVARRMVQEGTMHPGSYQDFLPIIKLTRVVDRELFTKRQG